MKLDIRSKGDFGDVAIDLRKQANFKIAFDNKLTLTSIVQSMKEINQLEGNTSTQKKVELLS